MAIYLSASLRDADIATCLVKRFLASAAAGRARYSGAYFERIGSRGNRPETVNRFTAENLLAVTILSAPPG